MEAVRAGTSVMVARARMCPAAPTAAPISVIATVPRDASIAWALPQPLLPLLLAAAVGGALVLGALFPGLGLLRSVHIALAPKVPVLAASVPAMPPMRETALTVVVPVTAFPVLADLTRLAVAAPRVQTPPASVAGPSPPGALAAPGTPHHAMAPAQTFGFFSARPAVQSQPVEGTRILPLGTEPAPGALAAIDLEFGSQSGIGRCEVDELPPAASVPQSPAADGFGLALAAAAMRQTAEFVVYTDKYRKISFPMGDVPAMFGVCTDVVIRAYRSLGIDLQALIHGARIGNRDPSIAHRRTFTLRRYFASRGASLPVTDFAEDYLPGDIVTYDRPQNRGSRDHIAIVSNTIAPSGRPMIVHNRGWGPQLEDALFVDKITGHYRFRGGAGPIAAGSGSNDRAAAATVPASLPPLSIRQRRSEAVKAVLKARGLHKGKTLTR